VLTLKAAAMLDLDAVEIVRPGSCGSRKTGLPAGNARRRLRAVFTTVRSDRDKSRRK
jgi:hypothetical protein